MEGYIVGEECESVSFVGEVVGGVGAVHFVIDIGDGYVGVDEVGCGALSALVDYCVVDI